MSKPKPNDADLESRVKQIVAEQFGHATDFVQTDSHFMNDLGGDSLDSVELAMAIEDDFDIEIPDEEMEAIHTVQDLLEYLKRVL